MEKDQKERKIMRLPSPYTLNLTTSLPSLIVTVGLSLFENCFHQRSPEFSFLLLYLRGELLQ